MRIKILHVLRFAAVCGVIVMVVTGCGKKDDPIAQAEKKDQAKGIAAPGVAETKAIAEEEFIYGLPLVMNCFLPSITAIKFISQLR